MSNDNRTLRGINSTLTHLGGSILFQNGNLSLGHPLIAFFIIPSLILMMFKSVGIAPDFDVSNPSVYFAQWDKLNTVEPYRYPNNFKEVVSMIFIFSPINLLTGEDNNLLINNAKYVVTFFGCLTGAYSNEYRVSVETVALTDENLDKIYNRLGW